MVSVELRVGRMFLFLLLVVAYTMVAGFYLSPLSAAVIGLPVGILSFGLLRPIRYHHES